MNATTEKRMSVRDLLSLERGDDISAKLLSQTIILSKRPGSSVWEGEANSIGNTPQQGINWIGKLPRPKAVIVKIVPGRYGVDFSDGNEASIRYALKAQKGSVNRLEQANQALLLQPAFGFPVIVLVKKTPQTWRCAGKYDASASSWDNFVMLKRRDSKRRKQ